MLSSEVSVLSTKKQVSGAFIQGELYRILGGSDENFKKLKEFIISDDEGYILCSSLEALVGEAYDCMTKEKDEIRKERLGRCYDFLDIYFQ